MDYPEQRSDLGDGQDDKGAGNGGLFHDGRGWGVRDAMRKKVSTIIIGTFATEIKRSGEKTQKNRVNRAPPFANCGQEVAPTNLQMGL